MLEPIFDREREEEAGEGGGEWAEGWNEEVDDPPSKTCD
jgi:general stress protein YciG